MRARYYIRASYYSCPYLYNLYHMWVYTRSLFLVLSLYACSAEEWCIRTEIQQHSFPVHKMDRSWS